MFQPRQHWVGVLLVVLIACAVALTLAGPSGAATFGGTGGTAGPAIRSGPVTAAPGVTGGTAAPSSMASAPEPQSTTPPPKHHQAGLEDWQWLVIALAGGCAVFFVFVLAGMGRGRGDYSSQSQL